MFRRFVPALVVPLLLLSACATGGGKKTGPDDAARLPAYTEPVHPPVGRIASVNTRQGVAVVTLDPRGAAIFRAEGLTFASRRDDLTPTARLAGTTRRLGTHLGLRILEGEPTEGDEVVLLTPER
ncbi:MAG: hypothetical protein ABII82_06390 [Verrucomicrobiota bacterium]